jgi:hypothetical protein
VGVGLIFFGCKPKEEINPNSEYVEIPDVNFEKSLIELGIDSIRDGKVLRKNILKITSLNVSGDSKNRVDKVKSLKGIDAFLSLKELNCNDNLLNDLDITKNTALIVLLSQ